MHTHTSPPNKHTNTHPRGLLADPATTPCRGVHHISDSIHDVVNLEILGEVDERRGVELLLLLAIEVQVTLMDKRHLWEGREGERAWHVGEGRKGVGAAWGVAEKSLSTYYKREKGSKCYCQS